MWFPCSVTSLATAINRAVLCDIQNSDRAKYMAFWRVLLLWIRGRSVCGSDLSPPCKQHNRIRWCEGRHKHLAGRNSSCLTNGWKTHLATFWFCLKQHCRFVSVPGVHRKVFGGNGLSLAGLCCLWENLGLELKLSFEHCAKVAGASCAALVTC